MLDLARLHAAARCQRVTVRGRVAEQYVRRPGEAALAFHDRLRRGRPDATDAALPPADGPPVLAALFRGDVDLPPGSDAYALFRERVTPTLAASDLLS